MLMNMRDFNLTKARVRITEGHEPLYLRILPTVVQLCDMFECHILIAHRPAVLTVSREPTEQSGSDVDEHARL